MSTLPQRPTTLDDLEDALLEIIFACVCAVPQSHGRAVYKHSPALPAVSRRFAQVYAQVRASHRADQPSFSIHVAHSTACCALSTAVACRRRLGSIATAARQPSCRVQQLPRAGLLLPGCSWLPAELSAVGGSAYRLGGAGQAGPTTVGLWGRHAGGICCRCGLAVCPPASRAAAALPRLLRPGTARRGATARAGVSPLPDATDQLLLCRRLRGATCLLVIEPPPEIKPQWVLQSKNLLKPGRSVFPPTLLPRAAVPRRTARPAPDRGAPSGRLGRLRRRAAAGAAPLPRAAPPLAGLPAARPRWSRHARQLRAGAAAASAQLGCRSQSCCCLFAAGQELLGLRPRAAVPCRL